MATRPGLTNGERDDVIARCNVTDLIECTWTTDMRLAGQTWIGTVSQVVGQAGARTSISVDFGEYEHQVMRWGIGALPHLRRNEGASDRLTTWYVPK